MRGHATGIEPIIVATDFSPKDHDKYDVNEIIQYMSTQRWRKRYNCDQEGL